MKFRVFEELQDDIELMNKTSRLGDYTSVVTQYILKTFSPEQGLSFLDYGAGVLATQTKKLIEKGYNVTAYDMGKNVTPLHDENALGKRYDVVFASNVINVQFTMEQLEKVLSEMSNASREYMIMNYPGSPRKFRGRNLSNKEMKEVIEKFLDIELIQLPSTIFVGKK